MSVNESKEFEAINQATRERNANAQAASHGAEDACRAKKVKARNKATVFVVVTVAVLVAAVVGVSALEVIGWINSTFSVVLKCVAGCVAMFKTGYLWHEIKNGR